MIAFVFALIFLATSLGSMHISLRDMSTNTGVAPTCLMTSTVLTHVYGTVITSSPGPIPNASSESCRAFVHELTATHFSASQNCANCSSKSFTAGPLIKLFELHVLANNFDGSSSLFS